MSPSSQRRTRRLMKIRKPVADLESSTMSTTLLLVPVVSIDMSDMATHADTSRAIDRACEPAFYVNHNKLHVLSHAQCI